MNKKRSVGSRSDLIQTWCSARKPATENSLAQQPEAGQACDPRTTCSHSTTRNKPINPRLNPSSTQNPIINLVAQTHLRSNLRTEAQRRTNSRWPASQQESWSKQELWPAPWPEMCTLSCPAQMSAHVKLQRKQPFGLSGLDGAAMAIRLDFPIFAWFPPFRLSHTYFLPQLR